MPETGPPEKRSTPEGEGVCIADLEAPARLSLLPAALSVLKTHMSGLVKRLGFHAAALLCAFLISRGDVRDCFRAYIGLLCLIPSSFAPRDIRFLFPTAIGLGHLFPLCFWGTFSPGQALFIAGLQSWLLGAIIRRFRLGLNWLPFPFLLIGAAGGLHTIFPFSSFAFATLCGTAAYACAVRYTRTKEETERLPAEQESGPKKKGEFAEFGVSLALLRKKTRLAPALREHTKSLVRAAGDILACIREDPHARPAGTRFLLRYLPAAHTILDEHIRLRESAEHAHVQESLASGALMLERLAVAFRQEHGHLLRDDIMRFNAEMNTLDKLLKMDGR